jgi:hypothetical protein
VLLAALHHGDEGLEARARVRLRGDLDERALARLEKGPPLRPRARHQVADAGDGGGAEDQVHVGRALLDGPLPELRHAPHHADEEPGPSRFEPLECAELGVDLVLRLLADGASVQQDEVGVLGGVGELVALVLEEAGHPLRVVLVHLAAVGDQVEFGH